MPSTVIIRQDAPEISPNEHTSKYHGGGEALLAWRKPPFSFHKRANKRENHHLHCLSHGSKAGISQHQSLKSPKTHTRKSFIQSVNWPTIHHLLKLMKFKTWNQMPFSNSAIIEVPQNPIWVVPATFFFQINWNKYSNRWIITWVFMMGCCSLAWLIELFSNWGLCHQTELYILNNYLIQSFALIFDDFRWSNKSICTSIDYLFHWDAIIVAVRTEANIW